MRHHDKAPPAKGLADGASPGDPKAGGPA